MFSAELPPARPPAQGAEQLKNLERLTAGIAHDLGNALCLIRAYVGLLESTDLTGEQGDLLAGIRDTVGWSSDLSKQLMHLSCGRMLDPEFLDVNRHLEARSGLVREALGQLVGLELDLAGDLPSILVNVIQFDQILMNLVVNARNAMTRGGTLLIRTRAHSELNLVSLSLIDTGTGLNPAILSQIFNPDYTPAAVGMQSGLGLPTVQDLVLRNRGMLFVSSSAGQGTSFVVSFPSARKCLVT